MTDTAQPTPSYPPLNFPTIFVDNVATLFRGGGIVKFYFARFDPDMSSVALPNPVPVCQVVMPINGFAAMTVFFQQQLELMIQNKEIDLDLVDKLKSIVTQQVASQTSQPQQGQSNAS
jgi:hypothetical protein